MGLLDFSIGSRSSMSSFRMLSVFLARRISWDISFADSDVCDRNRYPFGAMDSSSGMSRISRVIDSLSKIPSKVRFERSVFALLSGRGE